MPDALVAVAGALRLGVLLAPYVVALVGSAASSPSTSATSGSSPASSADGGAEPAAPKGLDPEDVSPGISGFLATAAVVLVSIFLIINLVRRLRRIRYRAELEAREAEPAGDPRAPRLPPDDAVPGTVTKVEDTTIPRRPSRTAEPEHLE